MQDRIEALGGSGQPVVFAHANGYPPGSYRAFLEPLLGHCELTAYCHRPLWPGNRPAPVRADWAQFSKDLSTTLQASFQQPVWMMGHSLGAVVAMLAAVRKPTLFRGLILIDPVFVATRRAVALRMVPRDKVQNVALVRRALNRPRQFCDSREAFDFHRSKRAFAGMSDEVLWDYVGAGTEPSADGGIQLAYPPAWEAAVYASVPIVWPRLVRLRLPTLGLRGEDSEVLSASALRRWHRLQPRAELHTCAGGHLLPLEQPAATAARVIDFLGRQRD